jgi:hypothetical protein
MRWSCTTHWLLLGYGFAFLKGSSAAPPDETDGPRLNTADGTTQNVDPETFLGACPEYGQYASHKQLVLSYPGQTYE